MRVNLCLFFLRAVFQLFGEKNCSKNSLHRSQFSPFFLVLARSIAPTPVVSTNFAQLPESADVPFICAVVSAQFFSSLTIVRLCPSVSDVIRGSVNGPLVKCRKRNVRSQWYRLIPDIGGDNRGSDSAYDRTKKDTWKHLRLLNQALSFMPPFYNPVSPGDSPME